MDGSQRHDSPPKYLLEGTPQLKIELETGAQRRFLVMRLIQSGPKLGYSAPVEGSITGLHGTVAASVAIFLANYIGAALAGGRVVTLSFYRAGYRNDEGLRYEKLRLDSDEISFILS